MIINEGKALIYTILVSWMTKTHSKQNNNQQVYPIKEGS